MSSNRSFERKSRPRDRRSIQVHRLAARSPGCPPPSGSFLVLLQRWIAAVLGERESSTMRERGRLVLGSGIPALRVHGTLSSAIDIAKAANPSLNGSSGQNPARQAWRDAQINWP